ncbi:hypothetical protein NAEGRDRAFT_44817 [Naegleria gruberi]|uniref:Actin n=1 Tax=Naegleria gruberi TaxID=5762 RepID=D2VZ15_NAEGR|nr:uncharacterized protein NAEGRDRAFT_44817 [Naegleria gruberi]EFC37910.1 hypothetical protein NAEGRDRAFT_44817 [Naegleria gruberi]|eukprot:XP_002670654.1 hypothetical protein NAEGRDRAFT_44817 [Naegleria gruberi strain NEG-M]
MTKTAIIIDNGSCTMKVGIANEQDNTPTSIFPTLVGHHKKSTSTTIVGDEAIAKRGICTLKYPIEHCVITNIEAVREPKCNRERMTQIVFEEFNISSFYVAMQGVLALFASGKTSGIVLDLGESVSRAVPVYEGYALTHAISSWNFAGREITEYLVQAFAGCKIPYFAEHPTDVMTDMKHNICYVALDFDQENEKAVTDVSYELPDGSLINIGCERFKCTEELFNPNLDSHSGIHEQVFNSIRKCDMDVRKDMFSNIILAGGTTMFTGLSERVEKELSALAPSNVKINVEAPPFRKYSVWLGGSLLSSLSSFEPMWISCKEYDEIGPSIVHRKCF